MDAFFLVGVNSVTDQLNLVGFLLSLSTGLTVEE